MHVVLVAPEIATNTGNVIRLCANTGAALHLVEPLGFRLDDRSVRRAGLDYHELADVAVHPSLDACLAGIGADPSRVYALSSRGERTHDTVAHRDGDVLLFGAERSGLPEAVLAAVAPGNRLRIPMRPGNRSLNLANAVAVVVYEAWRQQGYAGAGPGVGSLAETVGGPPFDRTRRTRHR